MSLDTDCIEMVDRMEALFCARWRMASLAAVDQDLHDRLREQCGLFEEALFGPSDKETKLQAEATVRGWKAALARMEAIAAPDDAFLYGTDPVSGLVVAIGDRPRGDSALGDGVVFLTPGEVAKIIAGMGMIADVKRAFPNAEVLAINPPGKSA